MPWPFENDTRAIIKKLAQKSIQSDQERLKFTALTVVIAVALIMTLSCTLFFTRHKLSRQAEEMPQAFLYNIQADAYERLQNDASVEKIVARFAYPPIRYAGDVSLQTTFCNDPASLAATTFLGEWPKRADEIVLTSGSLPYLPDGTAIGSTLALNLGDGQRAYVVSGLLELASERTKRISVYCSEAYLRQNTSQEDRRFTLYLYFKGCKNWSPDDFQKQLERLSLDYQIPLEQSAVNSRYFVLSGQTISLKEALEFALLVLMVFLAAAVVIYNIFYISISRKMQEYGQLRTIGMTPRQVRAMLFAVGRKVAWPSTLAGILLGAAVGYFSQPEGWYLSGMLLSAGLSLLFGLLAVTISMHAPAKMASRVSPMAALNYSSYAHEKISERSRRYKITPLTLAVLNLTRDKKKTLLTVVSIGLCGVLLIASASMRHSLSEERMARAQEFQYGEFKLEFEGDPTLLEGRTGEAQNYRRAVLQAGSDVFNQTLKQEILAMDGVLGIKEWFGTTAHFALDGPGGAQDVTTVWGYTAEEVPKLAKTLIAGQYDPAEVSAHDGIIVNIAENVPQEVYHWTPKLGDQVRVSFWTKTGQVTEKTFTVQGITDGSDGFGGLFRLPLEQMQAVTGYDLTSDWEIITAPDQYDSVETALLALVQNTPALTLSTLKDYMNTLSGQYQSGIFLIYLLVAFLAAFGIINLVNLTVTNQIIRQKENGILRAVGLTKRQMWQASLYEGELLVLAAAFGTLAAGIPLSYAVTQLFQVAGAAASYQFPYKEYAAFLLALGLIEAALQLAFSHSVQQESVVELIKKH